MNEWLQIKISVDTFHKQNQLIWCANDNHFEFSFAIINEMQKEFLSVCLFFPRFCWFMPGNSFGRYILQFKSRKQTVRYKNRCMIWIRVWCEFAETKIISKYGTEIKNLKCSYNEINLIKLSPFLQLTLQHGSNN